MKAPLSFALLLLACCHCGLRARVSEPPQHPQFRYTVDPSLKAQQDPIPDGQGGLRPLAAMKDARGNVATFVENEILAFLQDEEELHNLLLRTKGKVISTDAVPPPPVGLAGSRYGPEFAKPLLYVVRVDPMRFGTEQFAEEAAALRLGGQKLKFLQRRQSGSWLKSHMNARPVLTYSSITFIMGICPPRRQEGATIVGGIPDAYAIPKFGTTGSKSSVTTAWEFVDAYRTLAPPLGQKKPRIAVIDGGFWLDTKGQPVSGVLNPSIIFNRSDLPAGPTPTLIPLQWDFVNNDSVADGMNGMLCTGGTICQWHGNRTAAVAAGILNNQYGEAGTGGQVSDIVLLKIAGTCNQLASALRTAVEYGADIINMSLGVAYYSWIYNPEGGPLEPIPPCYAQALAEARAYHVVLVASAGNDSKPVHSADEYVDTRYYPCMSEGVICVGALNDNTTSAIFYSNYGDEVTIWGSDQYPCHAGPRNARCRYC